jgi:hypothetical protein
MKDALARTRIPEGDGCLATLINYRMIANAVWTTEEAFLAEESCKLLAAEKVLHIFI